ncbi:MAG: hypothetical protein J5680_04700 [Neisseriaceae bacterium]|nr:hypothetical protein [Neisseriaceae bacterium]
MLWRCFEWQCVVGWATCCPRVLFYFSGCLKLFSKKFPQALDIFKINLIYFPN